MSNFVSQSPGPEDAPQWRPLSARDRRVVGVLVEKAKTTPTAYPMTLNAICTGSNQKSNRDPEMSLEPEQVQESLDRLRELGAVGEVQGDGRVAKYRHYLYKWLGVDKTELAVMTELLLRGAQTVGELRGRAARMEPIADIAALRPVIASLMAKGLVVSLTAEGRGQVVTHALYTASEMDRLKSEFRNFDPNAGGGDDEPATAHRAAPPVRPASPGGNSSVDTNASANAALREEVKSLRQELEELREETRTLRRDLDELRAVLS
jgi:uncharacterized protein YceH (UPF0502 family)